MSENHDLRGTTTIEPYTDEQLARSRGFVARERDNMPMMTGTVEKFLVTLDARDAEIRRLRGAINKVACDCEFLVRSSGGAQTHHVELLGQLLRAALAGKAIP